MIFKSSLQEDLDNGFTKTQLEILIDLPENSLASMLSGKRAISKKSQAKIKKWNASEKPDPLTLGKLNRPFVSADQNVDKFGSKTQVTDLTKPNRIIKAQGEFPKQNFTIDTTKKEIPPIPVRGQNENAFDFAARKNEWKIKYGQ